MPISPVDLYERLKPQLGEEGTKALIEYVDEKIKGEVATKEDLLFLKADLEKQIQGVRIDMEKLRADLEKQILGLRADLEKRIQDVRMLVIVVLVVVIILNPKVMELVGRILGVVK